MANKRKRKFRVIKTAVIAAVISGTFIYFGNKDTASATTIKYTEEEQVENLAFYNELENLATTDQIHFQNAELYKIVASKVKGILNTENIKQIKSLTIDETLMNNDLSDLKYLTDLRFLVISNNTIDLSNLQYNQNLNSLQIVNCEIYNSEYLPNSISYLSLEQTKIPEGVLTTPYNLSFLYLNYSPITKLDLKNPSFLKKLEVFYNSYFSLNDLSECTSLSKLRLFRCSSLKDPMVLTTLPSLKDLEIDEYASIWLDKETLEALPIHNSMKEVLQSSMEIIDEIYKEINKPNLSEEEKINNIIIYLVKKYKYDASVSSKTGEYEEIENLCNAEPIQSLNREEGIICINYACLFQALANRMGLDANEIENTTHAWNCVNMEEKLHYYDSTLLDCMDNQAILHALENNEVTGLTYYDMEPSFLENNSYNTAQNPVLYYPVTTELGYYEEEGIELTKALYNPYLFQVYTTENKKEILASLGIATICLYTLKIALKNFLDSLEELSNDTLKKRKYRDNFDEKLT